MDQKINLSLRNVVILRNNQGVSLIELMVALTVFAFFALSYVFMEKGNVSTQLYNHQRAFLEQICKRKLQEVLLDPPRFEEALTLVPKTGDFGDEGYSDYEFKIEYKKFQLPDLNKIMGSESESGENEGGQDTTSNIKTKLFEVMSKNMENLIWQVEVTVNKKNDELKFKLSAWVENPRAKINISL